jgi:ABC-type nitrate/sulfonate/bicarbonate transport system substrate-binding protein
VLARQGAGIKTVADLKGHKVALTPGTAPVQGFEDLLAANKVPPGSIQRVNATFTTMGQMLIGGSVDAMVGIEPYLTLTQMKMGSQGVMLARLGQYVQGGGLFYISNEWAAAHPTMVEPAIAALWEAEQFVRHNPEEAAAIEAAFIKADPAIVKATFRYLTFEPTIDSFTASSFDATARYLLKEGHIPHIVTAKVVLAPALKMDDALRRAHPEYLQ